MWFWWYHNRAQCLTLCAAFFMYNIVNVRYFANSLVSIVKNHLSPNLSPKGFIFT